MELIERPNMTAVYFMNSKTYEQYKKEYISDSIKNNEKKPTESDMKSWYKTLKSFCQTHIKTKGHTKRIYAYSQNSPAGIGGRLFCGNSLQGIWNVYRGLLMRGISTDIDMANAHPVILKYVCHKHEIPCPELDYYVQHRDKCLSAFPSRSKGKNAYLVATNNDVSNKHVRIERFQLYDKEMKRIQKDLLTLQDYKDLEETIPEYKLTQNYNGSMINRIMCFYENIILQHAITVINSKGLQIAILSFDGCQVYGDHYGDTNLLNDIQNHVNEIMPGLNMTWTYKHHDETMQIPEDFDELQEIGKINGSVANTDMECATIIYEARKDDLFFCNGQYFMKLNNIWSNNIQIIDAYMIVYIQNFNVYKISGEDKKTHVWSNRTPAEKVLKNIYALLVTNPKNNMYEKFHLTTVGRLCFLDGVLDFGMKKFYVWEEVDFEYYSTVQIERNYLDYFNAPDRNIIDKIKTDIFEPLFNVKMDTALIFFSRAFAGHCEDKNFATYMGNRNCGKGVLFDLFKAFGNYLHTFVIDNIMCGRNSHVSQESARMNYWLLPFEFVRVGFSQETDNLNESTNLKLDDKKMRKLQGGRDLQTARNNFDRHDTVFLIDTTLFLAGNHPLGITGDLGQQHLEFSSIVEFKTQEFLDVEHAKIKQMVDDGCSEFEIETEKTIVSKYRLSNENIKNLARSEAYHNAIIYLLFESYSNTKLTVFVEQNSEDDCGNNIIRKLLMDYEITKDHCDLVESKDLKYIGAVKKIKPELETVGVLYTRCKTGAYRDKCCFVGIKKRKREDVECEGDPLF